MKRVTKKSTSHGKWRGMCKIFTEFKKVKEEIPKKAVLIKRNSIYYPSRNAAKGGDEGNPKALNFIDYIYFILYEIND